MCVHLLQQLSDCRPVTAFSMETDTPTAEDIQLLKKTVESEASQVGGPSQPITVRVRWSCDPLAVPFFRRA